MLHADHAPDLGVPGGIATLDASTKLVRSQFPVTVETRDPGAGDDTTQGYVIGSLWVNTAAVPPRSWEAMGVDAAAASWVRLSNLKNNTSAVDPAAANDSTQGYEIGSHWVNVTTLRSFVAVSVSAGNAVWVRRSNRKVTEATRDPLTTDDSTQGYETFSRWINTTTKQGFECISAAASAAIWRQTSNVPGAGRQTPNQYFLDGSLLAFGAAGAHPGGSSTIQYTRVWLPAQTSFATIRVFVDSGGDANRHVRVGIYSQSDPLNETQGPATRVATSNEVGTATTGYLNVSLTGTYVVPASGYYWIAFVADTTSVKFLVTGTVYPANVQPRRAESTTGTTLPATTAVTANPSAAVAYVSAIAS